MKNSLSTSEQVCKLGLLVPMFVFSLGSEGNFMLLYLLFLAQWSLVHDQCYYAEQ